MHIRARKCREALELSQEDVALKLDISQKVYSKFESGITKKPDLNFKIALGKVFKVSPAWLEYEETDPPSYLTEYPQKQAGKVPLIEWYEIPDVFDKPERLLNQSSKLLDITYSREKNLFATKIPNTVESGKSNLYFREGEIALISPNREPASKQHVLIIEKDWLEPVFAVYWLKGESPCVRYPWELNLRRVTHKMQICGVVIATFHPFLLLEL